jgi:AcrR family transcriptional regulator
MEKGVSQPGSADRPNPTNMFIAYKRVSSLLEGALSAHKVDPQLIAMAQERLFAALQHHTDDDEQKEPTIAGLSGMFLEMVLKPEFLADERTWGLIEDIGEQPLYKDGMANALVEAMERYPNHAERIEDCLILISKEKAVALRKERRAEQQIAIQNEVRSKLPPLSAINSQF